MAGLPNKSRTDRAQIPDGVFRSPLPDQLQQRLVPEAGDGLVPDERHGLLRIRLNRGCGRQHPLEVSREIFGLGPWQVECGCNCFRRGRNGIGSDVLPA